MKMPWEIAERATPMPIGAVDRSPIRDRFRLRRHIGKPCPYCNNIMNRDRGYNGRMAPSRDHDVPRSRGGLDHPRNVVICCRGCNERKGSLTGEEYRAVLSGLASRLDHKLQARNETFKRTAEGWPVVPICR